MANCGNIIIHCSKDISLNAYEFGISQKNKNTPYFWGGEATTINNERVQRFEGLETGNYKWFVRDIARRHIVAEGFSQVNCSADSDGSIKTFFFSNVLAIQENSYTFDLTTKTINLLDSHEIFGRNFEVLISSFNGIVVRTTFATQPDLSKFDDITFSQNSFNISQQFLLDENLFSITVQNFQF